MAKKILVIDDEDLIIRSLAKLIKKCGYDIAVSGSCEEALIKIVHFEIDLIISDIRMPEINGIETIRKIYEKLILNNCNKIPVIFITGYADKEMEENAKILNPVGYIYKPFDIKEIKILIDEVFK